MQGKTVVCIGSGPSLTQSDCDLVQRSGFPTIVINNAWESARFADILFGGDYAWWLNNGASVDIPAQRWTSSDQAAERYKLNYFRPKDRHWHGGLRAIQLAVHFGAARVILLGYDCTVKKGVHYNGLHANTSNPTEGVCAGWRLQFKYLAAQLKIPVINCSRNTALKAFARANLEDELCLKPFPGVMPPKMSLSSALS